MILIWAWGAIIYFIITALAAAMGGFEWFIRIFSTRFMGNLVLWGAIIVNSVLWPITLPVHILKVYKNRHLYRRRRRA